MESLRRAFGIAEPVRRGMEMKIVRDGTFKPAVLGGSKVGNVHEDILAIGGRDTEVGWEDVFQGMFFLFFSCSSLVILLWIGLTNCRRRAQRAPYFPRRDGEEIAHGFMNWGFSVLISCCLHFRHYAQS